MIYIVDSWAWIEYFIGSKSGLFLKNLLKEKNHKFITMECSLAEVRSYCIRTHNDFSKLHAALKRNSIILPVLQEHWLEAAQIKHESRKKVNGFGLIDSILVAKQNELKCKIVSGDGHFKGMKNAIFIGE